MDPGVRSSAHGGPSTDPLRQPKSEVTRHEFCGGAQIAGQNGFGYFRRNESTSWGGGETPRRALSPQATHSKRALQSSQRPLMVVNYSTVLKKAEESV